MRGGRAYSGTLAKDMLRVEVADVKYAIEVRRVKEIINPLPLIDLPRSLPLVLGVAEYRDQVLTVVELRRLFGLASQEDTKRTKWVVVGSGDRAVAFVVDAVLDVFSSEEHPKRSVPELDAKDRARGIKSAYKHHDELVFLLDADRLAAPAAELSSDDLRLLSPEST